MTRKFGNMFRTDNKQYRGSAGPDRTGTGKAKKQSI